MRMWDIPRKLLAVAALFTLLAASTPALAESLSTSASPACCNTANCPVHHREARDMQKDKSNCDAHGKPAATDGSMRACDSSPNQAVGTAPFMLAAPNAILYEATAEAAPLSRSGFAPFVMNLPSAPPPRTVTS